jgi:dTDP-glucose pyrophosphorylase/predicted transcriptional regulator
MKDWHKIIVDPDTSILKVLEIIDRGALQFAIVVDTDRKLVGTVTDGDIRRGILKGKSLETPVSQIMNTKPTTTGINESKELIFQRMKLEGLKQLPIVGEDNRIISVEFFEDLIQSKIRSNVVCLMAGGLGKRLKPLTDNIPKPLLKVGNKPILLTIIESFLEYGFNNFLISVNYKAELIEGYFKDGSQFGAKINYIRERMQLGTAGALSLLKQEMEEPFFVMNGDILTKINFSQLLDFHLESKAIGTMCVRPFDYQVPYGVVETDGMYLKNIIEKPSFQYFVNAGIYVLEPEVLGFIPYNTYFDMPSLFNTALEKGKSTVIFPLREYWLDIGHLPDFNRANDDYENIFG